MHEYYVQQRPVHGDDGPESDSAPGRQKKMWSVNFLEIYWTKMDIFISHSVCVVLD